MSISFLIAALLAPAQQAETPRAFVERIYAGYRREDFDPLASSELVFGAALLAAMNEDARLSTDEVGYMDMDPLCQCQDATELRPVVRQVRQASRLRATAHILLDFGGSDRRDVSLKLVRTGAGWRIADIATPDEPSMLRSIERFNRRRSREGQAR